MNTLLAMRHAPPCDSSTYLCDDTPLCKEALKYVADAAKVVQSHSIEHVVVSPQLRARQTASLLIKRAAVEISFTTDVRIGAKSYGRLQGRQKELPAGPGKHPVALCDRMFHAPEGGESYFEVALRVSTFLASTLEVNQRRLIVTHDAVIKVLVAFCEGNLDVLFDTFPYGAVVDVSEIYDDFGYKMASFFGEVDLLRKGMEHGKGNCSNWRRACAASAR